MAASIIVSSSGMQVFDAIGTLLIEFSYFEPVEEVAAELAELTGVEPTIAPYAGGGDTPPGTSYDWGSITIRNGWPMQDPFYPGYHAFVTGTTIGPLDIAAIGGIAVGDNFDAVVAEHPFADPTLSGYASLDILNLPENPDFPGVQLTFSVLVIGDAEGDQITTFIAPSANWGA